MQETQRIRLDLGEVVGTPAVIETLNSAEVNVTDLLRRHQSGDWGELAVEDMMMMDRSALDGGWVMSLYKIPPDDTRVYIMTEWDRSITTVMLADEY